MDLINEKILRAFKLTQDLVTHLDEAHLSLCLPDLPSNTIGEQIWCIVGSRESYLKALINEKWAGFSCSLESTTSKTAILETLTQSEQAVIQFIANNTLNETQANILFDLFEHEIQHHGQLIRYVYGN
jgi:uncharacterized damage-inducible protein DinB